MRRAISRTLPVLLFLYAAASLVHFVHNAEFLADYPNLPVSWSRADVYLAWVLMTALGALGWWLVLRGFTIPGLAVVVVYAGLGLDSLGHYLVAPMSSHSSAMNTTILAEVTTAALVLMSAVTALVAQWRK